MWSKLRDRAELRWLSLLCLFMMEVVGLHSLRSQQRHKRDLLGLERGS